MHIQVEVIILKAYELEALHPFVPSNYWTKYILMQLRVMGQYVKMIIIILSFYRIYHVLILSFANGPSFCRFNDYWDLGEDERPALIGSISSWGSGRFMRIRILFERYCAKRLLKIGQIDFSFSFFFLFSNGCELVLHDNTSLSPP